MLFMKTKIKMIKFLCFFPRTFLFVLFYFITVEIVSLVRVCAFIIEQFHLYLVFVHFGPVYN